MSDLLHTIPSWSQMERVAEAMEKIAGSVDRNATKIFAMHIDGQESNPANKITYLEDCANFEPAYMDFTKGRFNWGSWKDVFFMPRPCMLKNSGEVDYYLNEYDYTKKVDGTASDAANPDYEGNAMMEWGRNGRQIWYKVVPDQDDDESATVYFSDAQVDKYYQAWSFVNHQDKLVSHFYTPIYNGSLINNVLRSISGQAVSKSKNVQAEMTAAKLNNKTNETMWMTEVLSDRILITLLLFLIFRTTDSPAAAGQGLISGGETAFNNYKTGALDDKGMFFGYSDNTHAVKVFGMENYWGLQWRRTAGLINDKGTCKYKLTAGTVDGSTAKDYNFDGSGYIVGGALPTASGSYIAKMTYTPDGMMQPKTVGASSSTHYCDGLWTNNGQVDYARFGGYSDRGVVCGAVYCALDGAPGIAWWGNGASVSCKPLAQAGESAA